MNEDERLLAQPLRSVGDLTPMAIPATPGVYAWYRHGRLFYVGETHRGLRSRIWGNHIRGNARGSTLRNKVAKAFGFDPIAFRKYGREAEQEITNKLKECEVRFLALPAQRVSGVQAELIALLDPAMNDHPGSTPRWRVDEVREILGVVARGTDSPAPRSSAKNRRDSGSPTRRPPDWHEVCELINRLADSQEWFPTITGKPNRIVAYEPDRRLLVETETGVNWVQIDWIEKHWRTFGRKRRTSRDDFLHPGRRSAFMMALFRQVPGVIEEPGRPTFLVLQ